MLELAYKALDILLGMLFGSRRVRVRVHFATLLPAGEAAAFIKVVNLSTSRDVEVTHIWIAGTRNIPIINLDRPLPARLRPDETWETWIPIRDIPAALLNSLFNLVRVQLSSGKIFKSKQNKNVPEVGHVAGGGNPLQVAAAAASAPAEAIAINNAVPRRLAATRELRQAEPEPNIVVVDMQALPIALNQYGLLELSPTSPDYVGAAVIFRNEATGGRPIGYLHNTRAHLVVKSEGEKKKVVNSGYWLESEYNTVDIGCGEAKTLVLALLSADGSRMSVLNDRRESSDDYEAPLGAPIAADEADFDVKLAGGWEAEHVYEFRFKVRRRPHIEIEER
ncbi:MAG TPA: hypothetical protein VJV21_08025 [Pyrinomonadaceae bacterium]|nr:hypothetical protein [Pyrinomonadaceae bacterium]